MKTLDVRAPGVKGRIQIPSDPLGKGGEGSVYSVENHSVEGLPPGNSLVAKIYHDPTDGDRKQKVVSMISTPPNADDALAWPIAMVSENGQFQGYLMKKLDSKSFRPWLEVAHSSTRRKKAPDFTSQYALYSVRNLAEALISIHQAGHMVGDINESNIFVSSQASVMIVDTDSAQIKSPRGDIYPCIVGKPEYTAPEISKGSLRDHRRTPETDSFAFGVAVFQILTGGAHPADGIYKINDDPPSTVEKIREGIFPGIGKGGRKFDPVPRVASRGIPSRIMSLLSGLLEVNPDSRTGLEEALNVFDDVLENLQQCRKVKTHFYDSRDKRCGWCEHAKAQPDPWSNEKPKEKKVAQKTLPGVNFKDTKAPPKKAPRSRVSTNGSSAGGSYGPTSSYQQTSNRPTPSRNLRQARANNGRAAGLFDGANGGSPTYTQQQTQPVPQQRRSVPDKIKGKMVVHYADGTYGPRPSFSALASAGKWGIIKDAIGAEYPSILKFWWAENRDAPQVAGLVFGLLGGIAGAYLWIPLMEAILRQWNDVDFVQSFAPLYSSIGAFSGLIFTLLTFILSFITFIKLKVRGIRSENPVYTFLRFPLIGFFYGLLPFIVAIGILFAILKFLIDAIANSR